MKNLKQEASNKTIAYNGALMSTTAIFLYSFQVMIYVLLTTSSFIFSAMPAGERASILWANGLAVAYSVAVFSIAMAIISAPIGAVSLLLIKICLQYFNPLFDFKKAIAISGAVALSLLGVVYILLRLILKDWMTLQYPEPLLFWFVLPAIIFLSVCIVGGYQLNKALVSHYKNDKSAIS
jgi:hypothetical protein